VAQTSEVQAVDTEVEMKAARLEAGAEQGPAVANASQPEELVPAEVSQDLLKQMEEMVRPGGGRAGAR
jgi:hypothetical protein